MSVSVPDDETVLDPFAAELALSADGLVREFNQAGVLSAADVHVATGLGRLSEAHDQEVLLAVALAVRAPRTGHVFVDLASISATAAVESETPVELTALPWPEVDGWVATVAAASRLVAVSETGGGGEPGLVRPLRLEGTRLYLDRYWHEERALAAILGGLTVSGIRPIELSWLAPALERIFPEPGSGLARAAAACALLRGLSVIAGGPGTGKTTAVARIVALLAEHAASTGTPAPLVALCAPTGKAAARLEQAVREEAGRLQISAELATGLRDLHASTIHRLLGWRPGSHSRFRHNATNRLPHDVVIVDETSMVGLSLMGRLLEAVRADARVVLVGDPDQLTAIEAGAVLRDIVGPAAAGLRIGTGMRAVLDRVTGGGLPGPTRDAPAPARSFGDGVVVLERGHRFGAAIDAVAGSIRRGDGDGVITALGAAPAEVTWIPVDVAGGDRGGDPALAPLREHAVTAGAAVRAAAQAGDAAAAIAALAGFRLLCAHRHGPYGVAGWTAELERWLADADGPAPALRERDYLGRPLLITANDYELRLFNGDTGVIVRSGPNRVSAAFEREGELVLIAPARLGAAETLQAMTIHKSQGSQFDVAAILLPDPSSRILTRELLYTAVTRARNKLLLVGSEEAIRAAVARPVARASGLRERLWEAPQLR